MIPKRCPSSRLTQSHERLHRGTHGAPMQPLAGFLCTTFTTIKADERQPTFWALLGKLLLTHCHAQRYISSMAFSKLYRIFRALYSILKAHVILHKYLPSWQCVAWKQRIFKALFFNPSRVSACILLDFPLVGYMRCYEFKTLLVKYLSVC